jgi:hypothetical protein
LAIRVFRSIDDATTIAATENQLGQSGKTVSLTTTPDRSKVRQIPT